MTGRYAHGAYFHSEDKILKKEGTASESNGGPNREKPTGQVNRGRGKVWSDRTSMRHIHDVLSIHDVGEQAGRNDIWIACDHP